ncbi:hypothetical protein B0T10DRAFT_56154 [Thelonectria olida]|uniref:Zn(2)-C6 fungal-type domain-containing protein n=1 Tax=Thelonectria olida TaxID=1576542 RepID=A0A9P8W5G5_9HYPO|nr:hypothetical protein B0T10DRAFT_56154 [Thelonectria olida]
MNPSIVQQKNKGPKACTTCAKAKARCIPGPDGSLKCDRCLRLNKPCLSQTPAPPRARKSPKLSKIAALEKRLEELSSHVQEGPSQPTTSPPPAKKPAPAEAFSTGDQWNFSHLFPIKTAVVGDKDVTQTPSPPREQQPTHQPWDSWWPTPQEAEMLLEGYRTIHSPLFPFALVPSHMSSLELRQHHPFMWKAVMMVGCFLDGARQVKLGKELLGEIGQAAVVDGARNLDLLHGLQMLLAWFHYALKGSQVTNLLFLARAMCVNLTFKDDPSLQGEERERNLAHMRAYAGTYYLNTLVFTANKRHDVLMNTELLETCCTVLESTMQYPTDEYLVKLVRIQQLAQSISLTMVIDNISKQAMKLPLTMVVRSFQDQLDLFSSSLSPALAENDALKSHAQIAQVLLYEIAISDQHTTETYVPLTDRLQLLWGCVRSLRSFYDTRFAHRELERPRFLCLSASDFAFALITGVKLLTLQVPGWNLGQISAELNMIEVMDSQIQDLVVIIARRKSGLFPDAAPGGKPPPEDPFSRLLRQLTTLRAMVKQEMERQAAGSATMQGMDFSQDLLTEDFDSEFWQNMGSAEVWNVVGDPAVLDVGM